MKLRRPKIINGMREAIRELLDEGMDWNRILFYLVRTFKPSFIELRSACHPLLEFKETEESERGLYATRVMRNQIRNFNKEKIFDQLIGTLKKKVLTFPPNSRAKNPKMVTRTQWTLDIVTTAELASMMHQRLTREDKGIKIRLRGLDNIILNPSHYNKEADKLLKQIERHRRRGKRIEVTK